MILMFFLEDIYFQQLECKTIVTIVAFNWKVNCNASQKIWHNFLKLSKIELSIKSLMPDVFLAKRSYGKKCQNILYQGLPGKYLTASYFVENAWKPGKSSYFRRER